MEAAVGFVHRLQPRATFTAGLARYACWILVGALVAPMAGAQTTPGTVSGTVRDETGRPLDSAVVALDPNTARRVVRADSGGRFRFERVASGMHELTVVAIGYRTEIRTIDVPQAGLDIDILLRVNTSLLDTMHILARRTGVYGTVLAHDAFRPLAGADLQLIGTGGATTRSDPQGRFDMPQIGHGAYVVHVKHSGYQARMLSIVVPKDSAIELAITLDAGGGSGNRLATPLSEFDRRTRWMVSSNAALVPRQELAAHRGQSLWDALRYSMSYLVKGLVLDDSACVYVNGVFQQAMTARDYLVSDIEAVEVYGSGADYTATVTARSGQRPSRLPPGAVCGAAARAQALSNGVGLRENVMQRRQRSSVHPSRVEAIVIWLKQ